MAPAAAFLTRTGTVSIEIAKRMIPLQPGDRVPTVAALAQDLDSGVGTVQRAIGLLQESGALRLDARGKLGTFVASIDRPALWRAAQELLLIGLMPLPYTRRYEGLATGLREAFERLEIPFSLAFMSGAGNRLDTLRTRQGFAVVSRLAAERALAVGGGGFEIVEDFGPETYVEGHALVWRNRRRPRKPRVGVDSHSVDQVELARLEFGADADFVDVPYLQVLDHLRRGEFDVTVWAKDALSAVDDLDVSDLSSRSDPSQPANTSAVLVVAEGDDLTAGLIRAELDSEAVRETQRAVLVGDQPPRY